MRGGDHRRLAGGALCVGVVVAMLCGCGPLRPGDSGPDTVLIGPSTPASSTVPAPAVEVSAVDNLFTPEVVSIPAGTEVIWRNDGAIEHNIVPVDGSDEYGVELADFGPGATYAHTFDRAGAYRYYCTIHGTKDRGMVGAIEVTG